MTPKASAEYGLANLGPAFGSPHVCPHDMQRLTCNLLTQLQVEKCLIGTQGCHSQAYHSTKLAASVTTGPPALEVVTPAQQVIKIAQLLLPLLLLPTHNEIKCAR